MLLLITSFTVTAELAYVAIIIDDIGHNKSRGLRAINLPGPVTFAVLPYSPYAKTLSEDAHQLNKEVIIHLPMANITNHPLGPGGLTDLLDKQDFLATLDRAIQRVPHARGINNHTGSYLTQKTQQMNWLMDDLKQRDFFFIDSRTTNKTVAQKIAREKHILTSSRDVFLDNDTSIYEIDRAFQKLVRLAKKNGTAIAIGHPYPHTIEYLEQAIPQLEMQGIKIIPASNLIALQQIQRQALARAATAAAAAAAE